jgi:penicillin-binding protein 1A
MEDIHKGVPKNDFKVPDNIIFQRIDAETGLLPGPETKDTILECFVKGTEPTKTSPVKEQVKDKTDFFKFGM